jgi:hypothetical protein
MVAGWLLGWLPRTMVELGLNAGHAASNMHLPACVLMLSRCAIRVKCQLLNCHAVAAHSGGWGIWAGAESAMDMADSQDIEKQTCGTSAHGPTVTARKWRTLRSRF